MDEGSRPFSAGRRRTRCRGRALRDAPDAFAEDRRDTPLGRDDARLVPGADDRQRSPLDELGIAAAADGEGAPGGGAARGDKALRGVAVVADDVGGNGIQGDGGGHEIPFAGEVAMESIFSCSP